MTNLPNDPFLCLSVVNTKLRDFYPNIEALCQDMNINQDDLFQKLNAIEYTYDSKQNQFV